MARDANALFDGSIKNIFGKKNYTPISASNYLIYDFFGILIETGNIVLAANGIV